MKPYYEHAGITIYHGDCREILPTLPKVDLVLTDPPYGIGAGREKPHNGWRDYGIDDWDDARPTKDTMDKILSSCKNSIIWGGNYFSDMLPPSMGWLVWDKGQRDFSLADGELAWTSYERALRIKTISRGRALRDVKQHPTQKSLEILIWCIECADKSGKIDTILDPFMGSGTTLRAAKDLGRKAIGIEIEEKYCEIAVRRLGQEVLFTAQQGRKE